MNALDAYFEEVEARFEHALDFTVGLEEEFQILDPRTLGLTSGFETLRDAASPELGERVAGELLRSEIEVRTARSLHFGQAAMQLRQNRAAIFPIAEQLGFELAAVGTHPFSRWQDQQIIDTPHYRLVEESLKYVAWRNNTWAVHMHVGVRGLDRAIAVCDALRGYLPHLLALSANSPFIEGVWTQLASARTQTFVRMFPRCGIPDVFGDWAEHRRFYELLVNTRSIREFTQIWWSVRPHHRFGTVEIRICDAQTEPWESLAVSALGVALVTHLATLRDEGEPLPVQPTRNVEENLWRAIRYGLDGRLIDFDRQVEEPAADAIRRLVESVAARAGGLGLEPHLCDIERLLREGNGAQRQVRAHQSGQTIGEVFAAVVAAGRRASLAEPVQIGGDAPRPTGM
jgi:carboxylate-amine ligase